MSKSFARSRRRSACTRFASSSTTSIFCFGIAVLSLVELLVGWRVPEPLTGLAGLFAFGVHLFAAHALQNHGADPSGYSLHLQVEFPGGIGWLNFDRAGHQGQGPFRAEPWNFLQLLPNPRGHDWGMFHIRRRDNEEALHRSRRSHGRQHEVLLEINTP